MNDFCLEDLNQPLKHASEKIPPNYERYLTESKLRNQKLKEINEREIKKGKDGEREEGFNVYFNGANKFGGADRKIGAGRKGTWRMEERCFDEERGATAPTRTRRRWGEATKVGVLTERGDRMFVRPSDYYSEDFEEERVEDDEIEEGGGCDEERRGRVKVTGGQYHPSVINEALFESTENPLNQNNEEFEEIYEDFKMDLSFGDMQTLRQSIVMHNKNNQSINNELSIIEENDKLFDSKEKLLVENEDYNDSRLRQIIAKVAQMSVEQQKRLLLSLETIEEKSEEIKKNVTLTIVLESNWGHDRKVGMTEFAFWSDKKEPLNIVNIKENQGISGGTVLSRLIDGKKNTTKENHMWSCDISMNNNIKIDIQVETLCVEDLKYLVIWNYNMSLNSLCIGVKEISLWAGETLLVRGTIEKALGNVAFNPPTILEIKSKEIKEEHTSGVSSPDFSSDEECLLDKLRNVQSNTFRTENNNIASSRKNSARFGRRSEMENSEDRDKLKELVEQFEKDTLMTKQSISLEKSWTSLSYFNKSHAGRLSFDQSNYISTSNINDLMKTNDIETELDEDFLIPELPIGKVLTLNILTTWGDPHYVGLTGIEMFASSGERIKSKRISADPSDVNILPGYGDDPRIVSNLLDCVNKTRDDVHMWLTPFTFGKNHVITVEFIKAVPLALLRLWNYNKSRIHSSRGAREVEISLDGLLIFRGEIGRASGVLGDDESGEVILFTSDDYILDLIGQNDEEFITIKEDVDSMDHSNSSTANELLASVTLRPLTANETLNDEEKKEDKPNSSVQASVFRPFTSSSASTKNKNTDKRLSTEIRLLITETWSDQPYFGLTGLQLLNDCGEVIPVDLTCVTSNISTLMKNNRSLEKIFDDVNITNDDEHMLLAPFSSGDKEHFINIKLSQPQRLSTLRIWNYNKSMDESYKGVKVLHVSLDSKVVSPERGYLLRRAPGHVFYDFVQEILVESEPSINTTVNNRNLPCGFVFQLNLYSTWNDSYYVGLNGIELYDQLFNKIEIGSHQVFAHPDSVNDLTPKCQRTSQTIDVRTPDKLVNSVNDTYDPKNMWLAPILPGYVNKIFLVFDYTVTVSMIRLWNYSKTPARGVKEFSVMVDDLLIYSGILPSSVSGSISRGILPHMNDILNPTNQHKTILFDLNNIKILSLEKGHILQNIDDHCQGQEVLFINDNISHIFSQENIKQPPNQKFRPTTSVNRDKNKWKTHG